MSLPTLVVLPGLDGTGKLLGEFVKQLGPGVDSLIVAYPKDQPLGYDQLEALAMTALPHTRPFVVLGESFSGPVAIRIAARSPLGLAGVILCGTFAKNPFPWLRGARWLASYLPIKSMPRWLRAPLMWGSASPRSAPGQTQRAIAGVSAAVIRRRIAALLAVDESGTLRRIRTPALVIQASRDRVISHAATQHIMECLPGAQLAAIDGPHLLLQSRPAECAAVVLQFMRAMS